MTAADVFSFLAVLVSLGTFYWANQIEKRLQTKADARYAFDGMVATPLEAKLSVLEAQMHELAQIVLDTTPEADRAAAVSRFLKREYTPWYYSTDGFLSANHEAKLQPLADLLATFQDDLAPCLDAVSGPLDEDGAAANANLLMALVAAFVARMRAQAQELRLKY